MCKCAVLHNCQSVMKKIMQFLSCGEREKTQEMEKELFWGNVKRLR